MARKIIKHRSQPFATFSRWLTPERAFRYLLSVHAKPTANCSAIQSSRNCPISAKFIRTFTKNRRVRWPGIAGLHFSVRVSVRRNYWSLPGTCRTTSLSPTRPHWRRCNAIPTILHGSLPFWALTTRSPQRRGSDCSGWRVIFVAFRGSGSETGHDRNTTSISDLSQRLFHAGHQGSIRTDPKEWFGGRGRITDHHKTNTGPRRSLFLFG